MYGLDGQGGVNEALRGRSKDAVRVPEILKACIRPASSNWLSAFIQDRKVCIVCK